MARTIARAAGAALVTAVAVAAVGAAPAPDARRKLISHSAARADAIAQLVKRIGAMKTASGATVGGFLAESPEIGAAIEAFLSGAPDSGDPNYAADGTCRVELVVTVDALADALKLIHARCYKGDRVKAADFDSLARENEAVLIQAKGTGRMRPEFQRSHLVPQAPSSPLSVPKPAAKFWAAQCSADAGRQAERAARLDGIRRLAARIEATPVTPAATLRQYVAASDDPNVDMRTFLKGARQVACRYHDDVPIVEADVEVRLRTVYASLRSWGQRHFNGDRAKIAPLEELTIRAADRTLSETGLGTPADKEVTDPTGGYAYIMALARVMPPWTTRTLTAEGSAATAGAAELAARIELALKLRRLSIAGTATVGQLADAYPNIKTAVRVIQQAAEVTRPATQPAGGGKVTASARVKLWDLWQVVLHFQKVGCLTGRAG